MSESEHQRDYLTIRYTSDQDGTGGLWVEAQSDGWAGRALAYFDDDDLKGFASEIGRFPISHDPVPAIRGGYLGSPSRPETMGIFEPIVELEATQLTSAGQIGIVVHRATHPWPDDLIRTKREVHLVLLTTYQQLTEFGQSLMMAVVQGRGEATIEADLLA